MTEKLITLLEVQDYDREISELEDVCNSIPVDIRKMLSELESVGRGCDEKEERLKALKVREARVELDVKDLETQIVRFKEQQMQARNNVVYSALETEISETRKKISSLEDDGIELMEEIETLEEEIRLWHEDYELQEREFKSREAELMRQKGEAEEKLEVLRARRNDVASRVPEDLRRRYQRVRDRKAGPVVVPLRGDTCAGCFGTIPIQRINEIRHDEDLKSCENCGRIIYCPDEDD